MSTYVLVHGACHDGSALQGVVEALRKRGHIAYAPTHAGHGSHAEPTVTHAAYTRSITEFIAERELHEIILVGHSLGGSVISKVAEAMPERLKRLIFWAAFVLQGGESMLDNFPPALREMLMQLASQSGNNTISQAFGVWRAALT